MVTGQKVRLLRLEMTGLGKTTIYALQSRGGFPMRVPITAHSVGWVEAEVQEWLLQRVALRTSLKIQDEPIPQAMEPP